MESKNEGLKRLIEQSRIFERKERNEPIMNDRPDDVYAYLNHLWRNLEEYKPRNYGIRHPVVPEIYIMENRSMWMFLAWFETDKDGKHHLINRQTKEEIPESEYRKYSWC